MVVEFVLHFNFCHYPQTPQVILSGFWVRLHGFFVRYMYIDGGNSVIDVNLQHEYAYLCRKCSMRMWRGLKTL